MHVVKEGGRSASSCVVGATSVIPEGQRAPRWSSWPGDDELAQNLEI